KDRSESSSAERRYSSGWPTSRNERRRSLPLSEKTRIEVYLPDVPKRAYQDLLDTLVREFTHTFGGCTILRGIEGRYLSQMGLVMADRINLVFTDVPILPEEDFALLSQYADYLRSTVAEGLEEEAVLIAAIKVYHAV